MATPYSFGLEMNDFVVDLFQYTVLIAVRIYLLHISNWTHFC